MGMMINEANVMQRNRNTFNKILSSLKRAKNNFNKSKWSRWYGITLKGPWFGQGIRSRVDVDMTDFYIERGGDKVFFVAKLKCEFQKLYYNSRNKSGDLAVDIIADWIKDVSSAGYRFAPDGIDLELDGNGLNSNSSESQIKASKLYKDLDSALQEISSSSAIKTQLDERVAKQLKTRENVIPVMWYNESKDTINYPLDDARKDNPNASRVRIDVGLDSVNAYGGLAGVCRFAIKYAPIESWVHFDLSDVPYVVSR